MNKKTIAICLLLFPAFHTKAQANINEHGFYIPHNLVEVNEQLDKILTTKAKSKFRQLTHSDFKNINNLYILEEWELSRWQDSTENRLTRYLDDFITPKPDIYGYEAADMRRHLVLLSYLRHLQNQSFDLATESLKINIIADSLAQVSQKIHQRNLVADSIDGVYIPRDLEDSFNQLNKILSASNKQEIKNPDGEYGLAAFHFSLGLWMRNNWQLWGGSRLQQYFEQRDITHPDNMSGIILTAYSGYLNGEKLDKKAVFIQNEVITDTSEVNIAPPPPLPKLTYPKPYRKFLRKRRIDDFEALPPEAYGEPVEIVN